MASSPTPQDLGRRYEKDFADRYGAKQTAGSGATPRYKLDVDHVSVLWSLKHTEAESFRLTAKDLLDAFAGAEGPGSRMVLPAMAVNVPAIREEVAVVRVRDLLALLRGEVVVNVKPTQRDVKRAFADPMAQFSEE